jgi:outer membrane protein X
MTKKSFSWKRMATVFAIAAVTMSTTAVAQEKGDMAAGGSLTLGAGDSYTNVGIGAKFRYNVLTPLRLEGAFTYFLPKDHLSMWTLGVNAHWLFPAGDRLTVYPLAGLGILGWKYSYDFGWGIADSASDSDIAIDLGGGVDFKLTDRLSLNAELKYKIADHWNRLLLSAGVAYKF